MKCKVCNKNIGLFEWLSSPIRYCEKCNIKEGIDFILKNKEFFFEGKIKKRSNQNENTRPT